MLDTRRQVLELPSCANHAGAIVCFAVPRDETVRGMRAVHELFVNQTDPVGIRTTTESDVRNN